MVRTILGFLGILFFMQGAVADMDLARVRVAEEPEEELWQGLHEQFLLGEEWMAQFDLAIKQGETVSSLMQMGTQPGLYLKLQTLRSFQEEIEAELESRVVVRYLAEGTSSSRFGMEGWIRNRSESFRRKLRLQKDSFSYSLFGLLSFAKEFDQERGYGLESLSSPIALEEYRAWKARLRSGRGLVSSESKWRKRVEAAAAEAPLDLRPTMDLESASPNPDLRVFPSLGTMGNITGSRFPQGSWSLTFDDGPGIQTPTVLRNLKTHGLKASFFVLTSQLEKSGELASFAIQAIQDGHDVYSHSYQHLQIPRLSSEEQKHEIEGALQAFESILGFRPDLFRLPYGAGVSNSVVRGNLLKSCQVHVFWNVDTLDWQDRDPATIFERAVTQMKTLGRGVILFHDIHRQSVIASEKLMFFLNSEGLNTIALSEFVRAENGGVKWGCEPNWD